MSCSHRAGAIRSPWTRCRYEREIDEGHRPALRRVLEHDAPAGRSIVLCVSDIAMPFPAAQQGRQPPQPAAETGGGGPQLELTDGWYCVRAVLDNPLSLLMRSGKIGLGECPRQQPPCSPDLARRHAVQRGGRSSSAGTSPWLQHICTALLSTALGWQLSTPDAQLPLLSPTVQGGLFLDCCMVFLQAPRCASVVRSCKGSRPTH